MRFSVLTEHRRFFAKQKHIEFENLLSPEQIALLQHEIEQTLSKRLKVPPLKLKELSPLDLYKEGFDLWRDNAIIKKSVFKNTFAQIASTLFATPLLRIAFDQYFGLSSGGPSPFAERLSLSQLSCVKPLSGAFFLSLSQETLTAPIEQTLCPVPSRAGNAVFFSSELPIAWDLLFALQNVHLLLVAYAPKHALYHLEKKDPHTHAWKKAGYVFGDKLKDSLHPILHRDG